ncbi:MAG: TetR/AcrR family transcriptional regulator [Treponema sp.]|nr:TetR/AcrR family transcriptional regulator [Treponema sp.]
MAVAVEHEKRRKQILEKALTVFIDDGFEDATFQKIADRCGITRTILYLYFKNKREIFTYSIKQFLLNAEENINAIRNNKSLNSIKKITDVFFAIFTLLEENRQLLLIILDYLRYLAKSGINPEERVRRRIVKLRHVLSSIVIEGIKAGEFKKVNIKTTGDYFYSFIESAIFQLAVLKRKDLSELKEIIVFAAGQLAET